MLVTLDLLPRPHHRPTGSSLKGAGGLPPPMGMGGDGPALAGGRLRPLPCHQHSNASISREPPTSSPQWEWEEAENPSNGAIRLLDDDRDVLAIPESPAHRLPTWEWEEADNPSNGAIRLLGDDRDVLSIDWGRIGRPSQMGMGGGGQPLNRGRAASSMSTRDALSPVRGGGRAPPPMGNGRWRVGV
ncbi:hypothetical protein ACJZ2D_002909 [Fusarium nematophilum]